MESQRGHQKTRIGTVVSNRMAKTIVVVVDRRVLHPIYKKYVRRRSRFMAHDEANSARIGDRVMIEETRPLSKCKRWRLKEVVRRAPEL